MPIAFRTVSLPTVREPSTQSASMATTTALKTTADASRKQGSAAAPAFAEVLNGLARRWEQQQNISRTLAKKLPRDARLLIDAQLAVNRLQFSATIVAKAGDGAAAMLRRLQQMGGS